MFAAAVLIPSAGAAQRLKPAFASATVPLLPMTQRYAVDSAALPRTYWVEGGVVGGSALAVFTILLFRGIAESPPTVGGMAMAGLIGASVGFPAGALIGSHFRKP